MADSLKLFSISLVLLLYNILLSSQVSNRLTYCNPLDIDYKYNFEQLNEQISYRSGADPVIVNHKGEYYLFVTISGGWWHSRDLLHWNFIVPDKWPMEDMCAPAALSVRDTLYLFQSTFDQRPIFISTEPETGHLKFYNRLLPRLKGATGPWDPDIFHDEQTDRWYMYWGSSNLFPIYGIELDKRKHLSYIGSARPLIYLHPEDHGWERFGRDHRDTIKPFIEGAWMTKYNNKYYLQYAGPGTEYNVYANATYTGTDPLGPFTYASYNPVSYKPGGFVTGAGHGNTFQDNYGNYWNTGTPWVAVNWNFERRIAMFPAGFDLDDQMYSDTRFGDFPHFMPSKKWHIREELFTGWMLLSYRKSCRASSETGSFSASNINDENPRTFWVASTNKAGGWIEMDLEHECKINAVQVNFTDYKSGIYDNDTSVYTRFKIYVSSDDKNWKLVGDLSHEKKDHPNAYIELEKPENARFVKYEHIYVASAHLAISDLRVFGSGNFSIPKVPEGFTVKRDQDERNAFASWTKQSNTVGYNILWGIARNKLYQCYQVFYDSDPAVEIRALNKGQKYFFAIEAFNETGVSKLSEIMECK